MKTCNHLTEHNPVDEFTCSNCGFHTEDIDRVEYDEYGDKNFYEFEIKYCPNCGAKVVE